MTYGYTPDELASLMVGAPAILKTLERAQQSVLDKMRGEFRAGRTDYVALVAEYVALYDQTQNITRALNSAMKKE